MLPTSLHAFRYAEYQWARECPGEGWVLVVEVDKGPWCNRLWGKT